MDSKSEEDKAKRRLDFPYPNAQGMTPEEIRDGLDGLVRFNQKLAAEKEAAEAKRKSSTGEPRAGA